MLQTKQTIRYNPTLVEKQILQRKKNKNVILDPHPSPSPRGLQIHLLRNAPF